MFLQHIAILTSSFYRHKWCHSAVIFSTSFAIGKLPLQKKMFEPD